MTLTPKQGHSALQLRGKNCTLMMTARPHYCDRGRVQVQVETDLEAWRIGLDVDSADMFPRYYFSVERAMLEMHDWLIARKQFVDDNWQELTYKEWLDDESKTSHTEPEQDRGSVGQD